MVEIKERLEVGSNEIIVLASDLTKQEIYQLKKQILQDHEDAKKHRDLQQSCQDGIAHVLFLDDIGKFKKDRQIVKRLEKTIKEIGSLEKYFAMIFCYGVPDKFIPLGTKSYENTKPIPWVNWDEVHAKLQKILEGKDG